MAVRLASGSELSDAGAILAQDVVRRLEREIIFGEHPAGAKIVEEDLSARYQVSRSPVREAFRRLEASGLIVREARKGVRVSPMSRADLDEVYSCRAALESLAAADAARLATAATSATIRTAFETMVAEESGHSVRGYFEANVAFTDTVLDASRNLTLIRLLDGVRKQAMRYRFFAYQKKPELIPLSVETNRDLVEAIETGNAMLARQITEMVIVRSWLAIRDLVGQTVISGATVRRARRSRS